MSSGGQAWNQFLGGSSVAEFEDLGVFRVVELFLDVSIDIVFEAFAVFRSGVFVIF